MAGVRPRHAVLRDGSRWEGARIRRLQREPGGELTLARLPGSTLEISIEGPWEVAPSGLALGRCGRLYLSDGAADRVVLLDTRTGARTFATGLGLSTPRGLAVAGDRLYVADAGNARLQVLRLPTLEVEGEIRGPLRAPTDCAADRAARIYVLDEDLGTVLRLLPSGAFDVAWGAAMAAHAELSSPAFLAVGDEDVLFVSERSGERVLSFDPGGALLGALDALDAGRPRALAAGPGRLYVADAATGEVRGFDPSGRADLGALPGFVGPVAAMAVDDAGGLLVKTGPEPQILELAADAGCAAGGRLVAGPLDAGVAQSWERVAVEAAAPRESRVALEVFLSDSEGPPGPGEWLPARSLDTLVPPPAGDGSGSEASQRYLWLRVRLTSRDRRRAPRLSQVRAATTAASYIEHLPAVYAREDEENGFLRRWLALYRAELGDAEELLDEMARRFEPATAPADHLDWLAGWLAFDLPGREAPEWSVPWLRELLLEAHDIYTRRGTRTGLREAIELRTGMRPQILEAFRSRSSWQLGASSRLGFDTGLAPSRPDGAVVPDPGETIVVGEYVVDESGPQEADDFAESLFTPTAHLFTVLLPAGRAPGEEERAALRRIVEEEKPAHTDFHLCLTEPRMRVGFQARVGLDSIVAGPPEPFALNVSRLGLDSTLAEGPGGGLGRVGERALVGQTTRLG